MVKNNCKIIIIHIHNKMPALWDSKVTFVSVSWILGLTLCTPFDLSLDFVTPCLIVSLGRRKIKGRGGGKTEDPKRKGKK